MYSNDTKPEVTVTANFKTPESAIWAMKLIDLAQTLEESTRRYRMSKARCEEDRSDAPDPETLEAYKERRDRAQAELLAHALAGGKCHR